MRFKIKRASSVSKELKNMFHAINFSKNDQDKLHSSQNNNKKVSSPQPFPQLSHFKVKSLSLKPSPPNVDFARLSKHLTTPQRAVPFCSLGVRDTAVAQLRAEPKPPKFYL